MMQILRLAQYGRILFLTSVDLKFFLLTTIFGSTGTESSSPEKKLLTDLMTLLLQNATSRFSKSKY